MKQILALHGLLQQGPVLQHQGLDLAEQVAVLFLQVAFQLAQQLNITQTRAYANMYISRVFKRFLELGSGIKGPYFALVVELRGGDVELLKVLLELRVVGLQPRVLQFSLVQLALQLLVVCRQQLGVIEKLTVRLVQPLKDDKVSISPSTY